MKENNILITGWGFPPPEIPVVELEINGSTSFVDSFICGSGMIPCSTSIAFPMSGVNIIPNNIIFQPRYTIFTDGIYDGMPPGTDNPAYLPITINI